MWKIVCATNLFLPKFLSPQPPFPKPSPHLSIYTGMVCTSMFVLLIVKSACYQHFNVAHEVRHSGLSDSLLDGSVFVKTSSISHVFQSFLSCCNLILTPIITKQFQKRKINSFRLIVLGSRVKKKKSLGEIACKQKTRGRPLQCTPLLSPSLLLIVFRCYSIYK